jgi:hypothetical protein
MSEKAEETKAADGEGEEQPADDAAEAMPEEPVAKGKREAIDKQVAFLEFK